MVVGWDLTHSVRNHGRITDYIASQKEGFILLPLDIVQKNNMLENENVVSLQQRVLFSGSDSILHLRVGPKRKYSLRLISSQKLATSDNMGVFPPAQWEENVCRSSKISTSALSGHECMEEEPVPPCTSASCSWHPSSSPLQGNLLLLPVRLLQVIFWKHYGISLYLGWTKPSYED